jgi:hypothetical protein
MTDGGSIKYKIGTGAWTFNSFFLQNPYNGLLGQMETITY